MQTTSATACSSCSIYKTKQAGAELSQAQASFQARIKTEKKKKKRIDCVRALAGHMAAAQSQSERTT